MLEGTIQTSPVYYLEIYNYKYFYNPITDTQFFHTPFSSFQKFRYYILSVIFSIKTTSAFSFTLSESWNFCDLDKELWTRAFSRILIFWALKKVSDKKHWSQRFGLVFIPIIGQHLGEFLEVLTFNGTAGWTNESCTNETNENCYLHYPNYFCCFSNAVKRNWVKKSGQLATHFNGLSFHTTLFSKNWFGKPQRKKKIKFVYSSVRQ